MISRPRSRRLLLALAFVAVFFAGVAVGALVLSSGTGDVSNPEVAFDEEAAPAQTVPQEGGERPRKDHFTWPVFGLTNQRTSYLPLKRSLRPPFTFTWAVRGSMLLEFPPVAGRRSLFLLKNNGALYAISRRTGQVLWKRKLGYLAASSPAYAYGTVYVTLLARGKGIRAGRVVAVRARDGRTRWSRKLPSRTESSPLVHRGRLYFGSEDGSVYALGARDGSLRWRYRAGGAVKGGLALDRGKLFFGDYAGRVHAVRAATGRKVWTTGTRGARFGLSAGRFYATPAVAYGRVYIGNVDGNVYAFATRDGKLAWRKKTGGYVYSSAAIAHVPGGRPTVYVGSYDHRLYALDARSGRVRWSRDAGGRISGGAVVLGDLVFVSTLNKRTKAFGARTGQPVWDTNKGAYNPAISDGRRIFLVGYSSLFSMKPRERGRRTREADGASAAERRRAEERRAERRREAEQRRRRRFERHLGLDHGHRHSRGAYGPGGPPRCHLHRHRTGEHVWSHPHCHRHVRRR